jgi:Tfp pilus assembly protein PilX
MKSAFQMVNNEEGSALIVALLMLVLLTIIGVSSTNTATVELQIVNNDLSYKRNFYLAEAAAMECAQTLENETNRNLLMPNGQPWLKDTTVDMAQLVPNWKTDFSNWTINSLASLNMASDANTQIRFAAVARGVAPGSSLDMTSQTQLYAFSTYGLYDSVRAGQSFIEIGYRKRF